MSDGNGFGRGIGFGRIPSVQTKTDEKDEARNVLRFFRIGFLIVLAMETVLYIALNTMFEGSDWSAIFNGLVIASGIGIMLYLSKRWGWQYYVDLDDPNSLSFPFSWRALGISLIWILGLSWAVVPTLIRIFNFPEGLAFMDAVRYMASTLAVGLFNAVVIPGAVLLARALLEIFDRYHSPVERAVEIEKRKTAIALKSLDWNLSHPPKEPEPIEERGSAAFLPSMRQRPIMDKDTQTKLAAIDFFEALVNEDIDMDELGWNTGQVLPRSYLELKTKLAKRLRDEVLIPAGYLEWVNPHNHRAGVRFRSDKKPEELLEIIKRTDTYTGSVIRVQG